MLKRSVLCFALIVWGVTNKAQANISNSDLHGRYFMVVWGYQSQDDDVVKSHTFASFYSGDDLAKGKVNPATISWLPSTGVVFPFGATVGRNFSLVQTLAMACRSGRELKSWGPYGIKPELYQRALRRIQLLRSGQVVYSMIDTEPRGRTSVFRG